MEGGVICGLPGDAVHVLVATMSANLVFEDPDFPVLSTRILPSMTDQQGALIELEVMNFSANPIAINSISIFGRADVFNPCEQPPPNYNPWQIVKLKVSKSGETKGAADYLGQLVPINVRVSRDICVGFFLDMTVPVEGSIAAKASGSIRLLIEAPPSLFPREGEYESYVNRKRTSSLLGFLNSVAVSAENKFVYPTSLEVKYEPSTESFR